MKEIIDICTPKSYTNFWYIFDMVLSQQKKFQAYPYSKIKLRV